MGVANMHEIQILEFGQIFKEHMLQHGRAQVVSPSSFWMFPKFEDQFIPHSQLARRMGLLQQEVLDEASCIVATFKILEINFIAQWDYDYNERCLNFFECTDLCLPQCKNEEKNTNVDACLQSGRTHMTFWKQNVHMYEQAFQFPKRLMSLNFIFFVV